jgi:DNA-binding NarL/FixJ family response regulator
MLLLTTWVRSRDQPELARLRAEPVPFQGFVIAAVGRMDCAMKHGRVLLADSHLGILGGVHSLLYTLFETVLMVADERSLIEAVTTYKPDLVVVDLSLRSEGEANVARRLMQRDPALRLIVLSVHDEPTVIGHMLSAGVAGFVLKRAAATDLILAVKEVLQGKVYVSAAVQQDRHESSDQRPTGLTDEG